MSHIHVSRNYLVTVWLSTTRILLRVPYPALYPQLWRVLWNIQNACTASVSGGAKARLTALSAAQATAMIAPSLRPCGEEEAEGWNKACS